jgi:uncharacterized membrane protein
MSEFILLLLAAAVWWADRVAMRQRLEKLERSVEQLQGAQVHAQASAPPIQKPVDDRVPTVPTATPPVTAQPPLQTSWQAPRHEDIIQAPAFEPYTRAEKPDADVIRPPRVTPTIAEMREPAAIALVRRFFTGGNLIVRVGILILFIGVAFLLRYAAEHSHLTISERLTGVAAGALALLTLGWRLRENRRGYALALQGGAVGVLYLTVFAALQLHQLNTGAAFALLAVVAALSAALAILQDAMALAVLGATGGYLAPVLTASPAGDQVALFSYFALLNLAVVGIAYYRSWRALNVLAFLFTYGIGIAWGVLRYQPEQLARTEPFLILFFLMFVAIAVLFAWRRAPTRSFYVDGTLVFGTPIVTAGLQASLVSDIPYALAYSSLILSAFYLTAGWLLLRWRRDTLKMLVESFLALGVAFELLAIPCALAGNWTAAAWALEGAAVLWIGLRQDRPLAVAAGLLLQVAAGLAYLHLFDLVSFAYLRAPTREPQILGAWLISVSGLLCAVQLRRERSPWLEPWRREACVALFAWALSWWLYAGIDESHRHVAATSLPGVIICLVAFTALLSSLLGGWLKWQLPRCAALLLWPALGLFELGTWGEAHPFAHAGLWAWPLSLVLGYLTLRRDERVASAPVSTALHCLGLWISVSVLTSEVAWQVGRTVRESATWSDAAWGVIPAVALWLAATGAAKTRWPFGAFPRAYAGWGAGGLAAYLLIWDLYMNFVCDGSASPLPYLPLINPMDAAQGLALLAVLRAMGVALVVHPAEQTAGWRQPFALAMTLAVFAWFNAMLLRTLFHYEHVGYDLASIAASILAQTSLTIFWCLLALAGMVWAHRHARRLSWMVGASLLGVVIGKLFLVDLLHTGTVPRIVSFLGVGLLMLVIGYFSPLPPQRDEGVA